jgi:hypothetical protein
MKTITLIILLLMIASPLLASEVVVWKNGRAITFNVNRDGDVVTISPDQSGSIVGNVNNGNLSELRQPSINPGKPNPGMSGSPYVGGADSQ